MPILCPHCSGPVSRAAGSGMQYGGGLVGGMLAAAFGPLTCPKCGTIPLAEFPAPVRKKVIATSVALVLGAGVIFGLVVLLLVHLQ